MINTELTQEKVQLNISAAFDSVNLINKPESSQEEIDLNLSHLRIMMTKEWFVTGLTKTQKTTINKLIIS